MSSFSNQKIQNLYDYLGDGFSETNFYYAEEAVLTEFTLFVEVLNKEDWRYFEENIEQWNSEFLEILGKLIVDCKSKKINPYLIEKIYCLSFVYCNYDDASSLLDNLVITLCEKSYLDKDLLKSVLNRLYQFIEGYVLFDMHNEKQLANEAIEHVQKKLRFGENKNE